MEDRKSIELPAGALVVLVGASGAGKTRFAERAFESTEVLSSDRFRAMLADDECDQSVSEAAFELLHLAARRRLERCRLTVVDATNTSVAARAALLCIASEAEAPAVAIVLETGLEDCIRHNRLRGHRIVATPVIEAQLAALSRSRETLTAEGFQDVHVIPMADADSIAVLPRK